MADYLHFFMNHPLLLKVKQTIPLRENGRIFRLQFWNDVAYFFLNMLLVAQLTGGLSDIICQILESLGPSPFKPFFQACPLWLQLLLACMILDLSTYIGHRLKHSVPFLWEFHSTHHMAKKMDFLIGFRFHPFDFLYAAVGLAASRYLVSMPFPVISAAVSIFYMYGVFIHSHLKVNLGPLQWVLGTPKFHHWHHDKTPDNSSKNFGSMFPCWDWLFGTLYLPKEELYPQEVGINGPSPESFIGQLLYPLPFHKPKDKNHISAVVPFPLTPEPDSVKEAL